MLYSCNVWGSQMKMIRFMVLIDFLNIVFTYLSSSLKQFIMSVPPGNVNFVNPFLHIHFLYVQASPDEVCGCPLQTKQFKDAGEVCRTAKRKCNKHPCWERMRRAEIDLEKLRQVGCQYMHIINELSIRTIECSNMKSTLIISLCCIIFVSLSIIQINKMLKCLTMY